ncbi:MAG: PQQ-dependent dehydrogenase, methanol/ethanol family [Alteripontixanthobacter sp.]
MARLGVRSIGAAALAIGLTVGLAACDALPTSFTAAGSVDAAALENAQADGANWITYGRNYEEQRFSPLDAVNTENVAGLGLAWHADMDTARGQEATPLVMDGKLYLTTAWSKVRAFDAATGEALWSYDPQVPGETAVKACCDVVNRGLAAWGDTLFLGTLDGRLVALDRDTGAVKWEKVTVDQDKSYTITGAPRVIDGKVLIGNGGAEFGVRGYIGAYDAATGDELWRFYTVPGGDEADEADYLKAAAQTWSGDIIGSDNDIGGGGTVWDAMAYDPELDLLYIGVGNGSPWNRAYRSPGEDGTGEGDNLYLSSIVAIRPETGEYVWHYQTTPGETWDFTATQHIMLADLEIDGEQRQVLMQAPKNGFFYVLDRATGEFLSGEPYVAVNWATGIDPDTGRPIENPETRIDKTGRPALVTPGALGGHNWHPMAFHPGEGLVYIPAFEAAMLYAPQADWKPDRARGFNVGFDLGAGDLPPDEGIRREVAGTISGKLIAWDPVAQEPRWTVEYPGPWNGGLLATAGGLVFQGTAGSEFIAYNAANGDKLWSFPAQTGVVAPPITYEVDGEQYVAVLAGWGGAFALSVDGGIIADKGPVRNISRLLVFKLGADGTLPEEPELAALPLDPPPSRASAATIAAGAKNYARYCAVCHAPGAVGSTLLPDLRRSGALANPVAWLAVVHDGALQDNGMASFSDSLSKEEMQQIREYVIFRANQDKAMENKKVAAR